MFLLYPWIHPRHAIHVPILEGESAIGPQFSIWSNQQHYAIIPICEAWQTNDERWLMLPCIIILTPPLLAGDAHDVVKCPKHNSISNSSNEDNCFAVLQVLLSTRLSVLVFSRLHVMPAMSCCICIFHPCGNLLLIVAITAIFVAMVEIVTAIVVVVVDSQ